MYARRLSSIVQMKVKGRVAVIGEGLPLIAQNALATSVMRSSWARLIGTAMEPCSTARHWKTQPRWSFLSTWPAVGSAKADLVQKCVTDFYNHLARGIYAEAQDSNLADVVESIKSRGSIHS